MLQYVLIAAKHKCPLGAEFFRRKHSKPIIHTYKYYGGLFSTRGLVTCSWAGLPVSDVMTCTWTIKHNTVRAQSKTTRTIDLFHCAWTMSTQSFKFCLIHPLVRNVTKVVLEYFAHRYPWCGWLPRSRHGLCKSMFKLESWFTCPVNRICPEHWDFYIIHLLLLILCLKLKFFCY